MEVAANFDPTTVGGQYTTPSTSSTSSTSSTTSSSTLDPATETAIQAGAYLGYMAMLQTYLTGQTTSDYSSNVTVDAASNEANRIGAILYSFYNQYTSSSVPTSLSAVWADVGTALNILSTQGGSAMASWYADDSTSPVGDVTNLLSATTTSSTQFDPDTQFALTMFLASGNLQVGGTTSLVLQTTLSTGLETLLGDANETTNPFDNGNWMAAFLDSYVQSNASNYEVDGDSTYTVDGITGNNQALPANTGLPTQAALLQAILPATSSTTPNYNGFLSTFTGSTSAMNYTNWESTHTDDDASTLASLQGIMFWDQNILPTN